MSMPTPRQLLQDRQFILKRLERAERYFAWAIRLRSYLTATDLELPHFEFVFYKHKMASHEFELSAEQQEECEWMLEYSSRFILASEIDSALEHTFGDARFDHTIDWVRNGS